METHADAVVGVLSENLNVEQQKRLTIIVELATKPALLLFLDEPTPGLGSQTAWSICALLRKLADNSQAPLCTIHQPSVILFQEFDRLLFLSEGGKTVYFGDIGENFKVLTSYFERNGSTFGVDEKPAEVMLEVIGAAPGSETTINWPQFWNDSLERRSIKAALRDMKAKLNQKSVDHDPSALDPFAAPISIQLVTVTVRIFEQCWRTRSYLYSKTALCTAVGLFVGFSFWSSPSSLQGMQNQLFSIFMLLTVCGNLCQQIMPHFVTQRDLLYRNAEPTGEVAQRGGLMFLFIWSVLTFAGTFTDFVAAGIEAAERARNIANLMFSLCLTFCDAPASPDEVPGFWIFMYHISPFTYLASGMISVGIAKIQSSMRLHRITAFQPSLWPNVPTIHGVLHFFSRRLSPHRKRDDGLQLLFREGQEYVLDGTALRL